MQSSHALQNWFKNHIKDNGRPYTLDKNQAKIVLDDHQNTLVVARAGSGKTRTVVAKVVYLLTYKKVPPEEIIVFAFNRKARAEINERLSQITFDNQPIFTETPELATTFHAFAYNILGGASALRNRLISEAQDFEILNQIYDRVFKDKTKAERETIRQTLPSSKQFITRAEQQFFEDYHLLAEKIEFTKSETCKKHQQIFFDILQHYKTALKTQNLTNFNEIMVGAAEKIMRENIKMPYKYIFVDEYQDFSKLFLNLILAIRNQTKNAHLLAVGDDWQAINRFAGSNVDYFLNFQKYFPKDSVKLFIPTNYRSGKRIVKNANYFVGKTINDFKSPHAKNRLRSSIYYKNMKFETYREVVVDIIKQNRGKTIKILSRNNLLISQRIDLDKFVNKIKYSLKKQNVLASEEIDNITCSTIHRSKGLEADVVILLEIDENKFPSVDKSGGLYAVFGDTPDVLFADEARLFYVALTRAKEKLYILSKTPNPKKDSRYNFFRFLNNEYLEEL